MCCTSTPFGGCQPESPGGGFDPTHLGAMITLLRSLTESMPELPVVEAKEDVAHWRDISTLKH